MRAIFLKEDQEIKENEEFKIDDDRFHHLSKVIKVKKNEKILILNGKGKVLKSFVKDISKNEITFEITEVHIRIRKYNIEVLLGLPKRDAFELTLKNAVELGVQKMIPFISNYSNYNFKRRDRADKIIESSLIQSNNPFRLELVDPLELKHIKGTLDSYDYIFISSLSSNKEIKIGKISTKSLILIIIGPEGGFSNEEEKYFLESQNSSLINLPSPILRTPNALSALMGYIMAKFE